MVPVALSEKIAVKHGGVQRMRMSTHVQLTSCEERSRQLAAEAAAQPRAERAAKAARRWSMMLSARTAPPGLSVRES